MNINDKVVETLSQTIVDAVSTATENIDYDKTYTAIVTAILGNNKYSIKFNGAEYSAPLNVRNITLAINDFVKVTIPQNNWNNMYISNTVGTDSSSEGLGTIASGYHSHAEGRNTTASGSDSHAEGNRSTSSGNHSHAEGNTTTANNSCSHTEGGYTTANGDYSHSEGYRAQTTNSASHAEGYYTIASGLASHAEGGGTDSTKTTTASGSYSHAEGNHTTASGNSSHAEGQYCATYKDQAHAEGYMSHANGYWSHAEGNSTTNGKASHAEGSGTIAGGDYSHVEGFGTTSSGYISHTQGQYNKALTGNTTTYSATADAFVIGNGTGSSALSNAFRVTFDGKTYGLSAFNSTGADYSEYFEWLDGNPNNEDRVGNFVTLKGDKIKFANDGDYIVGIVSSVPAIIGDSASESWSNRYVTDIFGRIQYQKINFPAETKIVTHDDGTLEEVVIRECRTEIQPIQNPIYDKIKENEYRNRESRPEWDTIGIVGKLIAIDDGTCEVDGYCKPTNGIATKSDVGYRVMARLDETHIRILIK